jgi:hypothetical protein
MNCMYIQEVESSVLILKTNKLTPNRYLMNFNVAFVHISRLKYEIFYRSGRSAQPKSIKFKNLQVFNMNML